ncbi:hypothetical protein QAD60_08205 [Helicobacter pylori]|nr:hypothetical protein [Helicobacter pylori]
MKKIFKKKLQHDEQSAKWDTAKRLRKFVGHLERFKELLNEEVNSLSNHFHNLESWQDAKRERFSEVVDNLKVRF